MALFSPLKVGNCELQHRVVMAPLTRYRADDQHVHTQMGKEYYSQRASVPGTMIITEATFISPRGGGGRNVPGIWNEAQIKAWKEITDAVHAKGSFIWLQLWALGRAAEEDVMKEEGQRVLSSSAVPIDKGYPVPEELNEEGIQQFIQEYASAAKNAIAAGFDGVEIHGANGYLVDQFIQDTCNRRTDKWGGSIENRARFCLEVAKAVVNAVGHEKTGIRLSPFSTFQSMRMADPIPQFSYVIEHLKPLHLAYLHVVESRVSGNADIESTDKIDFAVDIWDETSPMLIAGGFKPASAKEAAEKYKNAAIVFGRYFIPNPDLPFRIKHGIELAPYDRKLFYVPKKPTGYTDYPFSKEFLASSSKI